MARRVQGEARVRASKQPPPTVMDHVATELSNACDRYLSLRTRLENDPDLMDEYKMTRGIIRGLAKAYCMWYGSTPGQPKNKMIKSTEVRFMTEAKERAASAS